MKKKKWQAASEIMAELQSDPEWVRQNAEREAKHKALVAKIAMEIEPENAPLLAELTAMGVKIRMNPNIQLTLESDKRPGETQVAISSISDLVNTKDSYPEVIPVLIKHMRTVQHPIMVESLARTLTVKEARGTDAARVILDRLKQTRPCENDFCDEYEARWALANALMVIADKSMKDEIKKLIEVPLFEDVKERLEAALKRLERLK